MKDCKGVIGRIFGHKFEVRYSTFVPKHLDGSKLAVWYYDPAESIRAMRTREYEGDVCRRCGLILNRFDRK